MKCPICEKSHGINNRWEICHECWEKTEKGYVAIVQVETEKTKKFQKEKQDWYDDHPIEEWVPDPVKAPEFEIMRHLSHEKAVRTGIVLWVPDYAALQYGAIFYNDRKRFVYAEQGWEEPLCKHIATLSKDWLRRNPLTCIIDYL